MSIHLDKFFYFFLKRMSRIDDEEVHDSYSTGERKRDEEKQAEKEGREEERIGEREERREKLASKTYPSTMMEDYLHDDNP